ncbi:MAG TPA: hypothetical protein VF168_14630 [Trueperaceae bacterium]
MDDRQRIEAMVEEGRITREEADRLLGVLDDIDQAEQKLEGMDAEVHSDPLPPRSPTATPADPPIPPSPRRADGGREERRLPEDIRWLEISLLAGDLQIEVSDSVTTPSASTSGRSHTELERTDDGFRLGGSSGNRGDNFLERMMSRIARDDTRVVIPADWGLRMNMKAGDVEIHGPLRFLAGHLLAGDLDADEVHGLDLDISAGDIDLGLLLDEGRHRLHAIAGDVRVRLLNGCDVRVSGKVNIGDLSLPEEWTMKNKGLGASFEHSLGQGRAELTLDLGTGDLDVGTRARGGEIRHG